MPIAQADVVDDALEEAGAGRLGRRRAWSGV